MALFSTHTLHVACTAGRVDRASDKPVPLGAAGRPAFDPEDVQVVVDALEHLGVHLLFLLCTRARRRRLCESVGVGVLLSAGRVREAARQRARGGGGVRRGRGARALARAAHRPARGARRLAAGRHSGASDRFALHFVPFVFVPHT